MLIAGSETEDIGLGTAQFAFRDRTAEDSVATVHAARKLCAWSRSLAGTSPESGYAVEPPAGARVPGPQRGSAVRDRPRVTHSELSLLGMRHAC
jgi:hypothetical protein